MRKVALIGFLGLIGWMIYAHYADNKRFNYPSEYDYAINHGIDLDYYDTGVVQDYYKTAFDIGQFARNQWYENKLDVRAGNKTSTKARDAIDAYEQMCNNARKIESKLIRSRELKEKGFNNSHIELLEEKGMNPDKLLLMEQLQALNSISLKQGDSGQNVWILEKLLNDHGHEVIQDGVYDQATESAVKGFQQKLGLFPSGIFDQATLSTFLYS